VLLPAIIGGLVIFGATTLYTDYWKQPNIDFQYYRLERYNVGEMSFANTGQTPADNLRITILPNNTNINNFEMDATQNTTIKGQISLVPTNWIFETRKFPVGATILLRPDNMNLSEPTLYFITISTDQGVKREVLLVYSNDTDKFIYGEPNEVLPQIYKGYEPPIEISPTIIALVAAGAFGVIYVLYRIKENRKLKTRDEYFKKISDEVYQHYVGQEPEVDKKVYLKNLSDIRNKIRNDFKIGKIKRSDYEKLENKIMESLEKMNKNGIQ
jgi:hypothetical protein